MTQDQLSFCFDREAVEKVAQLKGKDLDKVRIFHNGEYIEDARLISVSPKYNRAIVVVSGVMFLVEGISAIQEEGKWVIQ